MAASIPDQNLQYECHDGLCLRSGTTPAMPGDALIEAIGSPSNEKMNRILAILLIAGIFWLFAAAQPVLAAGTPQPADPSAQWQQPTGATSGLPWLGILVLGAAVAVYLVVKSKIPSTTVTANCCAPVIDEAKIERERISLLEFVQGAQSGDTPIEGVEP